MGKQGQEHLPQFSPSTPFPLNPRDSQMDRPRLHAPGFHCTVNSAFHFTPSHSAQADHLLEPSRSTAGARREAQPTVANPVWDDILLRCVGVAATTAINYRWIRKKETSSSSNFAFGSFFNNSTVLAEFAIALGVHQFKRCRVMFAVFIHLCLQSSYSLLQSCSLCNPINCQLTNLLIL